MIVYHWSPTRNRSSINKRGLMIGRKPTVCSNGHRNPHLSVCRTPLQAWSLSGDFLVKTGRECADSWDLWEINLDGVKYRTVPRWIEIEVVQHIPKRAVKYLATRTL